MVNNYKPGDKVTILKRLYLIKFFKLCHQFIYQFFELNALSSFLSPYSILSRGAQVVRCYLKRPTRRSLPTGRSAPQPSFLFFPIIPFFQYSIVLYFLSVLSPFAYSSVLST